MNQMTDAIMALNYAAECVEGKILSIKLDENAHNELERCFQDCAPTPIGDLGTNTMKKFMGIEIKKG